MMVLALLETPVDMPNQTVNIHAGWVIAQADRRARPQGAVRSTER